MTGKVFVDTNVLIYARDASEPRKQPRAMEWMAHLWNAGTGCLSFQVLLEYYVTVTRKLKPGLDPEVARDDVRSLLAWSPIPIDPVVIEGAWTVQDQSGLSWWDSLILSAAQVGGCTDLLSEDLQDGQTIGGVRVINPFLHKPE